MDPMLGMVFTIPWDWAPNGYQICQGQLLTIQQYAAVYALLGVRFGGDARTNFNLPNLQGRMPIGFGPASGVLPTNYLTVGASGGAANTTLSASNLVAHTHGATFTSGGGSGGSSVATGAVTLAVQGSAGTMSVSGTISPKALSTQTSGGVNVPSATAPTVGRVSSGSATFYSSNANDVAVPTSFTLDASGGTVSGTATGNVTLNVSGGGSSSGTVSIAPSGSSVPFSNVPPYLALNFIIAVQGLFPDRP